MKLWKKLLLVLLLLLLLSQIPFAYRRYKLGRLQATIHQIYFDLKVDEESDSNFLEYKGVMHVHSFLGGHSNGGFEEIIAAAGSNQLDFVVMTEHTSSNFNTAAMTLKGKHGGVIFINGNEASATNGDRLLLIPGDDQGTITNPSSTEELIAKNKLAGHWAFVAYPDQFKSWVATGVDGVELYNVYTNAQQINPLMMFFDGLWSYRGYPDLLFANFYQRPNESIAKWDQHINQTGQRLVATAGNDAHANVGISLNDATGKSLLGFKLDPYERSFRLVRMHVLVQHHPFLDGQLSFSRSLDEATVLEGLAAGHTFIGFDMFGDTTGFRFTARDSDENKIMGDEIKLENEVTLKVTVPVAARIVLFKDGAQIQQAAGASQMTFLAKEKGSYRVEVYPSQLPGRVAHQPWIISNPIYVR